MCAGGAEPERYLLKSMGDLLLEYIFVSSEP